MQFDILGFVLSFGYLGLFALIFIESGVFFGFFFPGDSVLLSVGLLASQGAFNIFVLVPLLCAAAILGDSAGYWFGATVGPRIFAREDSLFFPKRRVEETRKYFEKFGPPTVVLARFIPAIRTMAPILAGVGRMRYSLFLRYNILGGLLWAAGITLLGYTLGNTVPNIDHYIFPIIALIILTSFIPILFEWRKHRK